MGLAQHYGIPTLGLDVTDHLGCCALVCRNTLTAEGKLEGIRTTNHYQRRSARFETCHLRIAGYHVDASLLTPMEQEIARSQSVFRQHAFLPLRRLVCPPEQVRRGCGGRD